MHAHTHSVTQHAYSAHVCVHMHMQCVGMCVHDSVGRYTYTCMLGFPDCLKLIPQNCASYTLWPAKKPHFMHACHAAICPWNEEWHAYLYGTCASPLHQEGNEATRKYQQNHLTQKSPQTTAPSRRIVLISHASKEYLWLCSQHKPTIVSHH